MNGPTHMTCGALAGAVLAGPVSHLVPHVPHVPFIAVPLCIGIACVAGLGPDMDEPNAMLGRGSWMPRSFGWPLRLLAKLISRLIFTPIGYVAKGMLGHRGGTHSLAMTVVVTLACAIPITMLFGTGADWVIWTIAFGYLSHIAADMLNPTGCPIFWPLLPKHRCFHLIPGPMRISTETPPNGQEMMVAFAASGLTFTLLLLFFVVLPIAALLG